MSAGSTSSLQGFQGNHSAAWKQVRAQKSALRVELARVRTLGELRGVAAKLRSSQTGLVLADHNFGWNIPLSWCTFKTEPKIPPSLVYPARLQEPLAIGKWFEWMNRSGANSYSKVLWNRVLGTD